MMGMNMELSDGTSRSNAPNFTSIFFSEPKVGIGTYGDAGRGSIQSGDRELSEGATGSISSNLVHTPLREPEVAIGATRDTFRRAVRSRILKLSDGMGFGPH